MWVLGLAVYYAFFKLTFASYGYHVITDFRNAPLIYRRNGFQLVIVGAGLLLFGLSVYFFFASSPWLALVPFVLLPPSWGRLAYKRETEMHNIIRQCAVLSEQLKDKGLSQAEMNRQIVTSVLGHLKSYLPAYFPTSALILKTSNMSELVVCILICKGLAPSEAELRAELSLTFALLGDFGRF